MDPRRLGIFRTVARAGSLTAGARLLGWTQPAVSQHVAALEREAGVPLLVRGPSGVSLTEAGEALLRHADAVDSHLAAARAELAEFSSLGRGTVRLACFPSAMAVQVPDALARLAETAPDLAVHLVEVEPPEALAAVRAGDADLALVFRYDHDPVIDDLEVSAVADDPIRLVTPPGTAGESLGDFVDAVWVAGCERCRGHLVRVCAAAGFEPRIRHVTDDYVVVQALVARGLAVSLLPATALAAFRHPKIDVREVAGVGARRIELAARPGTTSVPAVAALVAALGR